MNSARKGQVAFFVLKQQLREIGTGLTPHFQQRITKEAKAIGISPDEIAEFMKLMINEMVNDMCVTYEKARTYSYEKKEGKGKKKKKKKKKKK